MVCTRTVLFRAQPSAGKSGIGPLATRTAPRFVAAPSVKLGPDLTPHSPTFGTGESGFGQRLTGGYGEGAASDGTDVIPASSTLTIEMRVTCSPAPASLSGICGVGGSGIYLAIGTDGKVTCGVSGSGGAVGSTTNICDGNPHHLALVSDDAGNTTKLFVDGVAEATAFKYAPAPSTTFQVGNLFSSFPMDSHQTIEELATWSIAKYSGTFTPQTAPYSGSEVGLVALYHLDGDLTSASTGSGAPNTYSLTCATGTFALPGRTAGLLFGRIMPAAGGSFVLTGNAVTPAITVPAARGQFVLTGNATGLSAQRKITAAFGSFALTGVAASLKKGFTLSAAAGSFTLSGIAAGLSKSSASSMGASVAAFTLTGRAAGLLVSRRITATVATFALTGRPAGLSAQRKLAMSFGAYSLSGSATGLFRGRKIAAGAGSFVLSGSDALLRRTLTVALGGSLFAVVGFPATLKRTSPGPSRFTVSRPTAAASVRPRQQEQRRVANLSRGRR